MPLEHIVAKGPQDHPRFSHELKRTRTAFIYGEMSGVECFQARDEYYALHPAAERKSWRKYLEDLAGDEYDEMLKAEATTRSRYARKDFPPSPGRAERVESCQGSVSPLHREYPSHSHGRQGIEDRRYREHRPNESENTFKDHRAAAVSRPSRHGKWAEPGVRSGRLNDSNGDRIFAQEQVCQEFSPFLEDKSLSDGIRGDARVPSAWEEPYNSATTGLRDSFGADMPPTSPSENTEGPSGSQQGPQSLFQPGDRQDRLSSGRYNAGVRALRSVETARPSIQVNDGQTSPSSGRYNAGVRVPRSTEGPSRKSRIRSNRASGPIGSVLPRVEEGNAVSV